MCAPAISVHVSTNLTGASDERLHMSSSLSDGNFIHLAYTVRRTGKKCCCVFWKICSGRWRGTAWPSQTPTAPLMGRATSVLRASNVKIWRSWASADKSWATVALMNSVLHLIWRIAWLFIFIFFFYGYPSANVQTLAATNRRYTQTHGEPLLTATNPIQLKGFVLKTTSFYLYSEPLKCIYHFWRGKCAIHPATLSAELRSNPVSARTAVHLIARQPWRRVFALSLTGNSILI